MFKSIYILLFFVFLSIASYADGYWLELSGSGRSGDTLSIRIRYGGVDEQKNRYLKKGLDLDKMKDFQVFVLDKDGRKTIIPIKQSEEYWAGYFIPGKDGFYRVLAIDSSLPVVERPDSLQNIKPVQYLCSQYQVGIGLALTGPVQWLDEEIWLRGKQLMIRPAINQKPVKKGTKLRVFFPDNHDEIIEVDDQGVAHLSLMEKGMYLIRLDQLHPQKGMMNTKSYSSIRHRCDYTFSWH